MSTAFRELGCLACPSGAGDLLIISYTPGEAGDVAAHGVTLRKNHNYGDPTVEYVCLKCDALYEHESFVMTEPEKLKHGWLDDAVGRPS